MIQKIAIVFNPISGRGKSGIESQGIQDLLHWAGYDAHLHQSSASYVENELEAWISGVDLLVVAGGDGTLIRSNLSSSIL